MKLTVGCDPEFFLYDYRNDTTLMSCGLIGGDKYQALPLSDKVSVLEDNVTVEINMSPVEHEPGSNALYEAALSGFEIVENHCKAKVNRHVGLLAASHQKFDERILKSHPQAMAFGCDPDVDAYRDGAKNVTFTPGEVGNIRFAGGHVHLGYDVDTCKVPRPAIVMMLEALCLVPWSAKHDVIGPERVKFYGRPGAYREKPYGLEWRTPSTFWFEAATVATNICDTAHWIINNPDGARMAYEQINFSMVKQFLQGELKEGIADAFRHQMRDLAAPIYAMSGIQGPRTWAEQNEEARIALGRR